MRLAERARNPRFAFPDRASSRLAPPRPSTRGARGGHATRGARAPGAELLPGAEPASKAEAAPRASTLAGSSLALLVLACAKATVETAEARPEEAEATPKLSGFSDSGGGALEPQAFAKSPGSQEPSPSALAATGEPQGFKLEEHPGSEARSPSALIASRSGPPTAPPPERIEPGLGHTRIVVTRSLAADLATAVEATLAPALAQVVKRVLVWWLDPRRDLRRGDVLEIIWREGEEGHERAEPVVAGLWLRSQKLGRERVGVFYRPPGAPYPRWFDPSGQEVALRLREGPIEAYEQITSLLGDGRRHRGVDFKAPEGTPVVAPFSGKVVRVNWATRRNGRCVRLLDPRSGREASFLHLSRIAPGVRVGARLRRGDRIGAVGNSGRSFAPHLHYQLEKGGRVLDPFRVHATWRARLSAHELPGLEARLRALEALRTGLEVK